MGFSGEYPAVEAASPDRIPTIAVAGGGASGLLLAAALLRRARPPLRVVLVEPGPAAGRGVAYGTRSLGHLLNVPAGRMGAEPSDPGGFLRWARARPGLADAAEGAFLPRRLYGEYLGAWLEESRAAAAPGVEFAAARTRAADLVEEDGRLALRLEDGGAVAADRVAVALGNSGGPLGIVPGGRGVAGDPWRPGALDGVPRDGAVVLVGTGLTMVDVLVSLRETGHRGPVHAVSRRGLLPQAHAAAPTGPPRDPLGPDPGPPRVARWLARFRAEERAAAARGEDWRPLLDGLRARTPELWRSLPLAQKRRFLRHLRPWWDTRRHRTAPAAARVVEEERAFGRVTVHAGRLGAVRDAGDGLEVRLLPRGGGTPLGIRAARVVLCTGPEGDPRRSTDPFVRRLLAAGVIRPDACGLGLDATPDGMLIGADGRASARVAALGPPLRGILWECTAVPEIRAQAVALAARWTGELGGRG